MKRINVVGTTGSGKSTFARALAKKLGYEYIQLDALFWKPDWEESTDEEFFAKISKAIETEHWVLDGNYHRTQALKWQHADTIIWLDYSYTRTLFQLTKRTLSRAISGRELWEGTGNRESFYKSFLTKDSILLWFYKAYPAIKKRYAALQHDPAISHIAFIRLGTPKQTRAFLTENISTQQDTGA